MYRPKREGELSEVHCIQATHPVDPKPDPTLRIDSTSDLPHPHELLQQHGLLADPSYCPLDLLFLFCSGTIIFAGKATPLPALLPGLGHGTPSLWSSMPLMVPDR